MKAALILLTLLISNAHADEFWDKLQEIQKNPAKAFETPKPKQPKCHVEEIQDEQGNWHRITVCK